MEDRAQVWAAMEAEGWARREGSAFLDHVGPLWLRQEAGGGWVTALCVDDRHLNLGGIAHGGLLATFADTSFGFLVRQHASDGPQATVQLAVSFIKPVLNGDRLEGRCRVDDQSGSTVFVSGLFTVGPRVVGRATAVFRLLRRPGVTTSGD